MILFRYTLMYFFCDFKIEKNQTIAMLLFTCCTVHFIYMTKSIKKIKQTIQIKTYFYFYFI